MITRRSLIMAASSFIAFPALAGGHGSKIMIEDAFIRASASSAVRVGGAFMILENSGDDDRLIAAKSNVAQTIELHTHLMQDGVMSMVAVDGGIPLPANETVMLEPGGYHIMMIGLHAPLVKGETVDMILVFEKAGEIPVSVPILGPAAMPASGDEDAHGHGGHNHGHDHTHHGSD